MNAAKSILVLSADVMLLDSRSRVLESAGFPVIRAMSLEDMERELKEKRFALLLLCHSLTQHDCQRATALAHEIDPSITAVVLAASCGPYIESTDAIVHQMSGPQKLVETVRTILC
jgi:DNA-binding response OmpR family regulator